RARARSDPPVDVRRVPARVPHGARTLLSSPRRGEGHFVSQGKDGGRPEEGGRETLTSRPEGHPHPRVGVPASAGPRVGRPAEAGTPTGDPVRASFQPQRASIDRGYAMHRVVLLWVGLVTGDVHEYSRPLD